MERSKILENPNLCACLPFGRERGALGLPEFRGTHHLLSPPKMTGARHPNVKGHMSFPGRGGGTVPPKIEGAHPLEGIGAQSSQNFGAQILKNLEADILH